MPYPSLFRSSTRSNFTVTIKGRHICEESTSIGDRKEHGRPRINSPGTLRLMGILWAVLDGRGPLLLEEPELSLHPEVVRFIPQMFARIQRRTGRQIMLSTHSADLLRDEGIGLDEVFLLSPGREGTEVSPASEFAEVKELLEG